MPLADFGAGVDKDAATSTIEEEDEEADDDDNEDDIETGAEACSAATALLISKESIIQTLSYPPSLPDTVQK